MTLLLLQGESVSGEGTLWLEVLCSGCAAIKPEASLALHP